MQLWGTTTATITTTTTATTIVITTITTTTTTTTTIITTNTNTMARHLRVELGRPKRLLCRRALVKEPDAELLAVDLLEGAQSEVIRAI